VLLALPALRALRAGNHRVALAAQPRIGGLLRALDEVDDATAFDRLDLHRLFVDAPAAPSPRLARAARVVCWFGAGDPDFARRLRAIAPGAIVAPPHAAGSIVWEHLWASVAGPGPVPAAVLAACGTPSALAQAGRGALRALGWDGRAPVLLVQPGAGGVAKRWPVDGFARVLAAQARGVAVVVHEGPADADAAPSLADRLGPAALRLRQPDLPLLAGVLACAQAYLGNDSGVSHLAAALGRPCLVLFSRANLAWRPWAAARCLVVRPGVTDPDDVRAVEAAMPELLAAARG
jgi:hypothetical protein